MAISKQALALVKNKEKELITQLSHISPSCFLV